jgi:hypothetical protein
MKKKPRYESRAFDGRIIHSAEIWSERAFKHAATDYSNEELFGIALGRQLCST